MPDPQFLSLSAAARLAGISPRALQRLAEAGTILSSAVPGDPKGKRVFLRGDIEALRAKIEQGFEVPSEPPKKKRPTSKPLVSDEEKRRWVEREYPREKLWTVRSLVRSYDLELREMVAHEAEVKWLRNLPDGRKLLGAKQSPRKTRSLGLLVQEILRELRSCAFHEVADHVEGARKLERQVNILRIFLQAQERRYGTRESRIAEIQVTPEELMRMFLTEENERGTQRGEKDPA